MLPIARWLARKYSRGNSALYDPLFSAAQLGLVKAARDYDPSKGASYLTFAIMKIKNELFTCLRDEVDPLTRYHRKEINEGRLQDVKVLGGECLTSQGRKWSGLEMVDIKDELEAALRKLPKRVGQILIDMYVHNKSMVEIARERGVSKQMISFLVIDSLKRFRARQSK